MSRRSISIAFFILLPLLRGSAQQVNEIPNHWDNGIGHSAWQLALQPSEDRQLRELWDSIGEDLKKSQHRLAGTYVKGGYNSGYFLRWSVGKGFIVIPYFDQNLITDFGYGKVSIADNSDVVFISERQLKGGRGLPSMPERWTSILGYLVPTQELKEFGQFLAGLGHYNEFNGSCCEFLPGFLCSKIDGEPLASEIPPKYRHFIKLAVSGEITSVGRKKTVKNWDYRGEFYQEWIPKAVIIPVTLNVGRNVGVRRNMLFRMLDESDSDQYVQVIRVNRTTSFAYVVRDISSSNKEIYRDRTTNEEKPLPPVRIGIRVTTKPWIVRSVPSFALSRRPGSRGLAGF